MASSDAYNGVSYTFAEDGGPSYIETGRYIDIETVNVVDQGTHRNLQVVKPAAPATTPAPANGYAYYEFQPSSVEYYSYKQCTMLDIHPKHGLI